METNLWNRPVCIVREVWLLRLHFCAQGARDLAGEVGSRVGRGADGGGGALPEGHRCRLKPDFSRSTERQLSRGCTGWG